MYEQPPLPLRKRRQRRFEQMESHKGTPGHLLDDMLVHSAAWQHLFLFNGRRHVSLAVSAMVIVKLLARSALLVVELGVRHLVGFLHSAAGRHQELHA
eukprot:CAMPEP_0171137014 /NCGR_PEP_ID=MMETSP0766_2-20121228/132564_1 /TAXON_ID=439317 /ORGANISM="Gambierdiscus australes, Strain CAWD 149" /LENGTH=97 /DNA_ID=CAMNT_0011600571 /DNA_START=179 /DNA_END=469 /DNA_ORIENTATION=-